MVDLRASSTTGIERTGLAIDGNDDDDLSSFNPGLAIDDDDALSSTAATDVEHTGVAIDDDDGEDDLSSFYVERSFAAALTVRVLSLLAAGLLTITLRIINLLAASSSSSSSLSLGTLPLQLL